VKGLEALEIRYRDEVESLLSGRCDPNGGRLGRRYRQLEWNLGLGDLHLTGRQTDDGSGEGADGHFEIVEAGGPFSIQGCASAGIERQLGAQVVHNTTEGQKVGPQPYFASY